MFQYPNQFAYQMPSLARANLQAMLNISSRVASSWQALAELNVQTMKKMVEESNALLSAGEASSAGDVLGWQSVMFAQFPQKAASYGQHLLSILTSTEADVIGEVRNQYERNGIRFADAADRAANDATEAAQSAGALVTDLADTANEATRDTSAVLLDANGEVAKSARGATKRSS